MAAAAPGPVLKNSPDQPLLQVCAPHVNQFIDPIVVMKVTAIDLKLVEILSCFATTLAF
jgi:hypothetical protein